MLRALFGTPLAPAAQLSGEVLQETNCHQSDVTWYVMRPCLEVRSGAIEWCTASPARARTTTLTLIAKGTYE